MTQFKFPNLKITIHLKQKDISIQYWKDLSRIPFFESDIFIRD